MDCEQALILISAALDDEITPSEREQLNEHLDLCADCRALAADFGLISAALAQEEPIPAGLTGRMEQKLDGAVREKKKNTFLRRYGSMAAMLAIVLSLGAIALSGGMGSKAKNDAAYRMFDAEMKAEAPAECAPMPSSAAVKGSAHDGLGYVTADSVTEAESAREPLMDAASDLNLYGKEQNGTENQAECLEPPAAEKPQEFDPPDHAVIHAALELVVDELMDVDGLDSPIEEDYSYCVLERTGGGNQYEETRLEYTGLSSNGKYYTFCLAGRTVTAPDSPAAGAAYSTLFNNFAVSRGLDEVLREYDENRTAEHQKVYRNALSD